MTAQQIQGYIQVAEILISLGVSIGGKLKGLIDLMHPGHSLTDEQINAIEAAAMADDRKRQAERIAMAG